MEPTDSEPGLVGRTSARLLAAGIGRDDRVAALRLLGILDATTDRSGRVRRPLDDLAAEFELDPLAVLRGLDHLEKAGALERDGHGVVVLGATPGELGGMRLVDFLDDLEASFDHGAVPPRRQAWLVRGAGALVAAAAVAVISLASGAPTAVERQPLAAGSTSVERTGPAGEAPATSAEQPATTASSASASTASSEPSGTAGATVTDDSGAPDTATVAAGSCPAGPPVATITGTVLRITNPAAADIVVTAVTAGGATLRVPITVLAGETVERDLRAPVGPTGATGATVDEWEWSDVTVARTCPS